MAAAEFIFAQYGADMRTKANPAGVVGMCNSMHGENKRAAMYNDKLKPLDDFIKEMKGQYQTSLGLGSSFNRDTSIQGIRRGRRRRGRAFYRGDRYRGQGYARGLNRGQPHEPAGYSRGRTARFEYPEIQPYHDGSQPMGGNGTPMQGPGVCYSFQAGTCKRGRSCKFTH